MSSTTLRRSFAALLVAGGLVLVAAGDAPAAPHQPPAAEAVKSPRDSATGLSVLSVPDVTVIPY